MAKAPVPDSETLCLESEFSEHLPSFCSALFSTSRELLSKCIPPRPIFSGHVFPPPNTLCSKVIYSSPLHSFLCRCFLKRGKAARAEVFIVTFPCPLLEAALVLSGQQPGLWGTPCTSSAEAEVPAGAQSLILSPASRPPQGIVLPREEKDRPPFRCRRQGDLRVTKSQFCPRSMPHSLAGKHTPRTSTALHGHPHITLALIPLFLPFPAAAALIPDC